MAEVAAPVTGEKRKIMDYSDCSLDDMLRIYYGRLFPYDAMHQWLSTGRKGEDSFSKREFSFTLANDIYMRFLSYNTPEEWKAEMMKKIPHKIDMGAVYTSEPKTKAMISKEAFQEVSREFVLDIDLTDYQEDGTIVTNCIDPSDPAFTKSWRFMAISCQVLDTALRVDFGFKHLLWVFSGRRGIHCWVCDDRARHMSNSARSAVAEYLSCLKGGDKEKTRLPGLAYPHPSLQRAFDDILWPQFPLCAEEQGWFSMEPKEEGGPPPAARTLDLVDNAEIKAKMLEEWGKKKNKNMSAHDKWEDLCQEIRRRIKGGKGGEMSAEEKIRFMVFKLTYPRLDIAVSKMMNHLLKSPFCVHPKTHRICVPLNPQRIEEFDPNDVPSVEDILMQMDAATKDDKGNVRTALDNYMKTFQNAFLKPFVAEAHREAQKEAQKEQDATMTF